MKNVLMYLWLTVFTVAAMIASIIGFQGKLSPFYAGLGWAETAVIGLVFVFVYAKFKTLVSDLEELKNIFSQFNKDDGE